QLETDTQLHLKADPDVSNDLSPIPTPGNYSSYRLSPEHSKWKRIIYLRITAGSRFNPISPRFYRANVVRRH
ncbi:hypothetical protein AVEN_164123-1, partial [Araneus ventricosus]